MGATGGRAYVPATGLPVPVAPTRPSCPSTPISAHSQDAPAPFHPHLPSLSTPLQLSVRRFLYTHLSVHSQDALGPLARQRVPRECVRVRIRGPPRVRACMHMHACACVRVRRCVAACMRAPVHAPPLPHPSSHDVLRSTTPRDTRDTRLMQASAQLRLTPPPPPSTPPPLPSRPSIPAPPLRPLHPPGGQPCMGAPASRHRGQGAVHAWMCLCVDVGAWVRACACACVRGAWGGWGRNPMDAIAPRAPPQRIPATHRRAPPRPARCMRPPTGRAAPTRAWTGTSGPRRPPSTSRGR
jgi:hypothetical protein